jgi:AcrR family transcriptional regulator
MTTSKAIRRAARRIGVEDGADFDERRKIILREAARAFNENGVENTSIEDIAKRLGVSKPAIYHYVRSKNDLIAQCLDMGNSITARLMQQAHEFEGNGLQK